MPPKMLHRSKYQNEKSREMLRFARRTYLPPSPTTNLSHYRFVSFRGNVCPPADTHQAAHKGQDYVTFRMKQISEVAATKKRRRRNGIGRGRFNLTRVF